MLTNNRNKKIGGPNLTVEIDESMFGKRKVCLYCSFVNIIDKISKMYIHSIIVGLSLVGGSYGSLEGSAEKRMTHFTLKYYI